MPNVHRDFVKQPLITTATTTAARAAAAAAAPAAVVVAAAPKTLNPKPFKPGALNDELHSEVWP